MIKPRIDRLRYAALVLLSLSACGHLLAQMGPASSTTSLTATPSTLVLPGGLQMTSVLNQTPTGAAVPTGSVNFYSDANLLGTAPLKIIPTTQTWTHIPLTGTPITFPVGIASVILAKGSQPVVVSAQTPSATAGSAAVALYKSSPGFSSYGVFTFVNPNQSTTDAIASGYFLQSKSSGVQSFVVHEYGNYQVFDGSTTSTANGLSLNPPQVTSTSGCDCSSDTETLAIDDFDNDGYSDIGVLIAPYSYQSFYSPAIAGVAINAGSSSPGTFGFFLRAPQPSSITSPALFCPIAVTTGHFTSDPGAQLAVLANTATVSCQGSSGPGTIYLYALDSTKSSLVQVGTPLVLPDAYATTFSAADLNHDGITDLVIGESIPGPSEAITGGIRAVVGNGDGSFQTQSSLVATSSPPALYTVNDFNGDGFLDVAFTMFDSYAILLGDGTGTLNGLKEYSYVPAITTAPGGIISADFNGDGLADLVSVPGTIYSSANTIDVELNTASSQAVLAIASKPISAGTHTLTATFPGDFNFASSTSSGVTEIVTKTTPAVTWTGSGATLEYGTLLSNLQLNATATVTGTFSYNPGSQALLPPGTDTITAAFTPSDSFDYANVVSTLTITVGSPTLSSISPSSADVGSTSAVITATGLGFVSGAVIAFNNNSLVTTYVDQHHLTAVIPSSLLLKPRSATITVTDPGGLTALGSQSFAVAAPPPVAKVLAAEASVTAGQQSTVTLTVNPYPVSIAATATITFAPTAPITTQDPAVLFSNNATTETVAIAPSSTPTATAFQFQSGSTAGTITVTIHLALAGGQDITPANLAPVTVSVPAGPPVLSSPTLTRSGQSLLITVIALSSTRDMTEARFHFTPAAGKSIKTMDVTVPLTTVFQAWYGSAASDAFGTNFMYTQPFTLDGNATDVASVTIILVNSNGTSDPATVQ